MKASINETGSVLTVSGFHASHIRLFKEWGNEIGPFNVMLNKQFDDFRECNTELLLTLVDLILENRNIGKPLPIINMGDLENVKVVTTKDNVKRLEFQAYGDGTLTKLRELMVFTSVFSAMVMTEASNADGVVAMDSGVDLVYQWKDDTPLPSIEELNDALNSTVVPLDDVNIMTLPGKTNSARAIRENNGSISVVCTIGVADEPVSQYNKDISDTVKILIAEYGKWTDELVRVHLGEIADYSKDGAFGTLSISTSDEDGIIVNLDLDADETAMNVLSDAFYLVKFLDMSSVPHEVSINGKKMVVSCSDETVDIEYLHNQLAEIV